MEYLAQKLRSRGRKSTVEPGGEEDVFARMWIWSTLSLWSSPLNHRLRWQDTVRHKIMQQFLTNGRGRKVTLGDSFFWSHGALSLAEKALDGEGPVVRGWRRSNVEGEKKNRRGSKYA